jgi:DNA-binding response OmpR family regulator
MLPLISEAAAAADTAVGTPLRGGCETILVVDDEAPIRECLKLFLDALGYRVLCAESGQAAIDTFRNQGDSIELVLMDVIMPHKNARETALEIREMRGDVRILFSSGYPSDLIYERKLLDRGEELIMKPLTPAELAVRLREALDRDRAA